MLLWFDWPAMTSMLPVLEMEITGCALMGPITANVPSTRIKPRSRSLAPVKLATHQLWTCHGLYVFVVNRRIEILGNVPIARQEDLDR